jgi:hypothetical protein
VDPCGLSADEPGCSTDTRNHLHAIAQGTGGFAVVDTNALESGVDRMIAENGTYYLLGYYSPAGVQVRAREGYVSPRQRPALSPAAPAHALISAPLQTRGLPMHLVAVPVPLDRRPGAAIALSIEIPAEEALRAREVGFTAIAIDGDGRVRARQQFTSGFTGTPAGSAAACLGAGLDVPPGRYQVRVAAVATNACGSVFTEVDVPKFDAPVSLGGLSLASSAAVPAASAERLGARGRSRRTPAPSSASPDDTGGSPAPRLHTPS